MHQKLDNVIDSYDYRGFTVGTPTTAALDAKRLVFLDNLRAIGVLTVFLYHAAIQVFPTFRIVMERGLNLGSFGVLLFFLCSGYIIPASIERSQSLGRFWIRRIFRIYPLFWCSVIAAVVLHRIGMGDISGAAASATAKDIVIQATMLQPLFGTPYFVVVYWTLWYEMVFYFLVSTLFVSSLLKRTTLITLALLILAVVVEAVVPITFNYAWSSKLLSYLAVMLVGTAIYREHSGENLLIRSKVVLLLAILMLFVTNISRMGFTAAIPAITAHTSALLLFGSVCFLGLLQTPSFLTPIGYISYSIYLIHVFVIMFIPRQAGNVTTIGVWLALTLVLSIVSYFVIERPTQRFGQSLSRRLR